MTDRFTGHAADAAVIVLYFFGILAFGSYFARYTKTTNDFFFAGRRFAWWLVAFSSVATTVGSYSFIKYSEAAYAYGFAATQTYTNDWMWMPLLTLGWIPILYYNRIRSVPEYFDLRFGTTARGLYTALLVLYMLGYVGINLYTLGLAVNSLVPGIGVQTAAAVVACFTAIYVTAGGQSSVIMTDLVQALLLLAAGFVVFFGGVVYLGGWSAFWEGVPSEARYSLGEFAGKPSIGFVKIFWQDGMANSFVFWFVNQGMVLRFLSARSARDASKAVLFTGLVLMPLASFAVCNAGLIGRSLVHWGLLDGEVDGGTIFVAVSRLVTIPGVFGLIMAALTAALMSTADTLVNGISAIAINDVWRPYLLPGRSDRFYLNFARWHCLGVMGFGLALVPVFQDFPTIYDAHGAFTAAVTPPLVVALFLAIVWKGFSRAGVLSVLILGTALVAVSLFFPQVVSPFAHGVVPEFKEGEPAYKTFKYMRACYGLGVCLAVGLLGTWAGRALGWKSDSGNTDRLAVGPLRELMRSFKGAEPKGGFGGPVPCRLQVDDSLEDPESVLIPPEVAERLEIDSGDLVYIADGRRWLGGLKSLHARVTGSSSREGFLCLSSAALDRARLDPNRPVAVQRFF